MSAQPLSFEDVNSAAFAAFPNLLSRWFPNGRLHGHEFRIGNLQGEPGESLSINTSTGVWRDFASDDGGSDPVSLYAAINSLDQAAAKDRLAEGLGLLAGNGKTSQRREGSKFAAPRTSEKTPEQRQAEARAIWQASAPALHTPAHAYLQGRGIVIDPPDCIQYHAGSHALIALVQARDDTFSGIQRVYLKTDECGTRRADRDKLSKGIIKGGAVRLTPAAKSLQLCESVEDGLALLQMTGKATWAVPGAGFMVDFEPPPEVREIVLAPDNDKAGLEVIEKARVKLPDIGKIRRLLPPPGKDWYYVLGTVEERAAIREFDGEEDREQAETRSWVEAFCDGD